MQRMKYLLIIAIINMYKGINTCCGLATLAAVLVNKVTLHIVRGAFT